MNELRRTIQNILLEEFACASITNPNIGGGIAEMERLGLHIVSAWSPEEYDSGVANNISLIVYDDLGDQKAYWLGAYQVTGEQCLGASSESSANSRR